MKARVLASLVVLATAGGAYSGSTAASAAPRPTVKYPSASIFWCTSDSSAFCTQTAIAYPAPGGAVPGGSHFTMLCYKNDRRPFGASSSDRWFYGWLDNGVEGYIWADQIANQARVPSCSAYGAPLAADWALGQLGVAYVPGGTPSNYWSGYCALFVYDSWLSYGNSPFMAPTAYQWYTKYATVPALPGSTGVNGRTRPPRGAYVWFGQTAGNAAAHVGLSLGNWQMVTTQGFAGDTKPVTVRGILDFEKVTGARYLGWSWPNAQAASAPFNNSGNGVVP